MGAQNDFLLFKINVLFWASLLF